MSNRRRRPTCCCPLQAASVGLLVLALAATTASAEIVTGTYVGNGNYDRLIEGLGFSPAVVIVKGDNAESAVIRTADTLSGWSKQMAQEVFPDMNRILDFTLDGFIIGTDNDVNDNGKTYYYIAFSVDPGSVEYGSYTGSGLSSEPISGLTFTPGMVILIPTNGARCRFVTSAMPVGNSAPFDEQSIESGLIESLDANGFTVSADWQANEFNTVYHYVAFIDDPAYMTYGSYTGDGAKDRPLAVTGFTPDWVLTKTAGNKGGAHLTKELSGLDNTLNFRRSGNFSHGILQLDATGFTIDDDNQVNEDGAAFYWAAFTDPPTGADLEVELSVDDASPEFNGTVTLTATLRNNGPGDITGGILDVDIPTYVAEQSVTPDPGATDDQSTADNLYFEYDIPAGQQRQVVAVYQIPQGGITRSFAGSVGGSSLPDPNAANDTATLDLTIPSADLVASFAADDATPDAGGTVQLTLSLDNTGPDAATGARCWVPVPAGMTLTTATPGTGTYDSGTHFWNAADLGPGGHVEMVLDFTVDADQGGQTLTPLANATSDRNELVPADNTGTIDLDIQAVSDLSIALAFDPATASTGDTVDLTVTVANLGSGDSATLAADVGLPAGLAYQSHRLCHTGPGQRRQQYTLQSNSGISEPWRHLCG